MIAPGRELREVLGRAGRVRPARGNFGFWSSEFDRLARVAGACEERIRAVRAAHDAGIVDHAGPHHRDDTWTPDPGAALLAPVERTLDRKLIEAVSYDGPLGGPRPRRLANRRRRSGTYGEIDLPGPPPR